MKLLTFPGGVHPPEKKEPTQNKKIETAPDPKIAVIPLLQHVGAPAEPIVKVGDLVKVGQKIGASSKLISCPVHASISGKVIALEPRPYLDGSKKLALVIENDGQNTLAENIKALPDPSSLNPEELIKIVREAGISGMGGAMFPTHVKLRPPKDKKINTVILNGAECEPRITIDHRLMLEHGQEILGGLKIIMKIVNAERGFIGIENNKPDAIKLFADLTRNEKNIRVAALKTKYPQGGEKQLITTITGGEVPSGGLPMDIGVLVHNVGTALAIQQAVTKGQPLIERPLTVTGGVKETKNLRVKIGTPFQDLIDFCGGPVGEIGKIITGGPMMGIAQSTTEVSVIKGTTGILLFSKKEATLDPPEPCIRCGKCIDSCPAGLMPNLLGDYAENERFADAENTGLFDCFECGACAYICPTKRKLVQLIKLAKAELKKK